MTLDWLRLWHDMPTDPKWRTIARASKQGIGDVMAIYLFLLTNASQCVTRGVLHGWRHEDVATALDLDESAVKDVFDAMQGRVLDGDKISGWDIRQPKREDSSTERMRKKREKERVTQGDASVTQSDAPEETRLDKNIDKKESPKRDDPDLFKTPKPKRKQKSKQEAHPAFERFKGVYPSRDGVQNWAEASKNFMNIVNAGNDPEILIKSAQTYARSVSGKTGDERKFVLQASSFLGPKKQAWREFLNGSAVGGVVPQQVSPDDWAIRVANFKADSTKWSRDWGPSPGQSGCIVPTSILEQSGVKISP